MSNCPKFLICTNKKDCIGRIYLLHSEFPRFLGEIFTFKTLNDFEKIKDNAPEKLLCKIGEEKHFVGTGFSIKEQAIGLIVYEFYDNTEFEEKLIEELMNSTTTWLQTYFAL